MKISKRQIRRIIKEGKAKLMENRPRLPGLEPGGPTLQPSGRYSGREYGDDNLRSTARLRKALESGELDWLDDFKSSAVMRHLEKITNRGS